MSASLKRPLEEAQVPANKRLDSNDDPVEKMEKDTLVQQRDAMSRALRLKNDELLSWQQRADEEVKRRSALEQQMVSIEVAWLQLATDVGSVLARLESAPVLPRALDLSRALREPVSLPQLLKDHASAVVSTASKLASLLERGNPSDSAAAAESNADAELRQLRARLAAAEASSQQELARSESLQKRLDDQTVDLEMRARKIIRLEGEITAAEARVLAAQANAAVAQPTPASASAAAASSSSATDPTAPSWEDRLEDMRVVAEGRLAELNALSEDRINLQREVDRLRHDLQDPPESLIVSSVAYRRLAQACEEFRHDAEQMRAAAMAARASTDEMTASRRDFTASVVAAEAERRNALEAELRSLQSESTRVRGERDTLKSTHDQLAGRVTGLENVVAETQKLLDATQAECAHLRSEVKRLSEGAAPSEDDLLAELSSLSKAFEDQQAQTKSLVKLLREREDAASRAHADKVKATQTAMTLVKEKEVASRRSAALQKQSVAQQEAIRKFESSEKLHQQELSALERVNVTLNASLEQHRRKTAEALHQLSEVQMAADKNHELLNEAQATLAGRSTAAEREAFAHRRLQEEVVLMKKRVAQLDKLEGAAAASADSMLKDELNSYKQLLRCSSCKNRDKAVVITQCYHCFCKECIDKRIESRQRKCPTCGEKFGVSDVHALYL